MKCIINAMTETEYKPRAKWWGYVKDGKRFLMRYHHTFAIFSDNEVLYSDYETKTDKIGVNYAIKYFNENIKKPNMAKTGKTIKGFNYSDASKLFDYHERTGLLPEKMSADDFKEIMARFNIKRDNEDFTDPSGGSGLHSHFKAGGFVSYEDQVIKELVKTGYEKPIAQHYLYEFYRYIDKNETPKESAKLVVKALDHKQEWGVDMKTGGTIKKFTYTIGGL